MGRLYFHCVGHSGNKPYWRYWQDPKIANPNRNFRVEKFWARKILKMAYFSANLFVSQKFSVWKKFRGEFFFTANFLSHKNFQFGKKCLGEISKMGSFSSNFLSHKNFRFGNKLGTGGKLLSFIFCLQKFSVYKEICGKEKLKMVCFQPIFSSQTCLAAHLFIQKSSTWSISLQMLWSGFKNCFYHQ